MRKKVMIMLLAASMIGSSVPAGVMAADVTDFAREAVGAEENETEILENTITPIPTKTPVPEETTVPKPTETPAPGEIEGPEPTEAPAPEMPELTVAPEPETPEVSVTPTPEPSPIPVKFTAKSANVEWIDYNTVQFELYANMPFAYYYAVTDKSASLEEVKQNYDAEKADKSVSVGDREPLTVNIPDGDDFQIWIYFKLEGETLKCGKIKISTDNRPGKIPGLTPSATRDPQLHKVSDCKVNGLEKPLKFYPNTFYNSKVTGVGEDNTDPIAGDEKYEPLYWSVYANPMERQQNKIWRIGTGAGITKAGTYNMYVFFRKYVYNDGGWAEGEIESLRVQFRAAEIKTPRLSATSVILKTGQSTTAVKVTNQSSGFKVKSWKSNNTSIAKVSSSGKITAGKKTGKTTITVTMSDRSTARINVTVQKGTVRTKDISGLKSKVTIKKGKTVTLKPVRKPATAQEKITYSTSNKKVATVNPKGVVKGVSKGKATITVRSGKIKKKVAVVIK